MNRDRRPPTPAAPRPAQDEAPPATRPPYTLPKDTRADIQRHLLRRKFSKDDVDKYLKGIEYAVDEWRLRWPDTDSTTQHEVMRRLNEIERHTEALLHLVTELPLDWRASLYIDLKDELAEKIGIDHVRFSLMEGHALLRVIHRALHQRLYSLDGPDSRHFAGKVHLVRRLAILFAETFNRRPSMTPNGPFMVTIGCVADALDVPIGKDTVADVLRDLKENPPEIYSHI